MVLGIALAFFLALPPRAGAVERFLEDAGGGVAAVFVNVGYMPVKLVYALLGGLTGGLAYGLTGGNYSIAQSIWTPSLGGTYVVTPAMLRGDESIYFSGESQPSGSHGSGLADESLEGR